MAEKLKGSVVFGQAAQLTAHNAYIRMNIHRRMAGMPILSDAPAYASDIPAVEFDDLWISPQTVCFIGLQQPSPNHLLVFKMTQSLSPGTSSGWEQAVIITLGKPPPARRHHPMRTHPQQIQLGPNPKHVRCSDLIHLQCRSREFPSQRFALQDQGQSIRYLHYR